MDDLLLKHIQAEEVGVWVNIHTKCYYLDNPSAQLVSFPDGGKCQSYMIVPFRTYRLEYQPRIRCTIAKY